MTFADLVAQLKRRTSPLPGLDIIEAAVQPCLHRFATAKFDDPDSARIMKTYSGLALVAGFVAYDTTMIVESISREGEVIHSSYTFPLIELPDVKSAKLVHSQDFGYFVQADNGIYAFNYQGTALTGTIDVRCCYVPATLAELPSIYDDDYIDIVLEMIEELKGNEPKEGEKVRAGNK